MWIICSNEANHLSWIHHAESGFRLLVLSVKSDPNNCFVNNLIYFTVTRLIIYWTAVPRLQHEPRSLNLVGEPYICLSFMFKRLKPFILWSFFFCFRRHFYFVIKLFEGWYQDESLCFEPQNQCTEVCLLYYIMRRMARLVLLNAPKEVERKLFWYILLLK